MLFTFSFSGLHIHVEVAMVILIHIGISAVAHWDYCNIINMNYHSSLTLSL